MKQTRCAIPVRLLGVALLLGAGLVACGDSAGTSGGDGSGATIFPGTTVMLDGPPVTIRLRLPGEAKPNELEGGAEWCPTVRTPDPPLSDDEMRAAAAIAERNLGAIYAYSSGHADEVGMAWLDNANDPPQVVIGFTAHVADHRRALADQLNDPKRVLVCQIRHSQVELVTVNAEIEHALMAADSGVYLSLSRSPDVVEVDLRADQEALAAQLVEDYGDTVAIRVGNFPYPMPTDLDSVEPAACHGTEIVGPTDINGLRATLVLDAGSVRSGQDINGTVTVTNSGNDTVSIESGGTIVGFVVLEGTETVVGGYVGAMSLGLALRSTLQPGQSAEVPVVIGTASCDPALGYALQAGRYEVVAAVGMSPPQPAGDSSSIQVVTVPSPLTVLP